MPRKKKPTETVDPPVVPVPDEYYCEECNLVFDGTESSVCPVCGVNFTFLNV
jgi:rubrerythrin